MKRCMLGWVCCCGFSDLWWQSLYHHGWFQLSGIGALTLVLGDCSVLRMPEGYPLSISCIVWVYHQPETCEMAWLRCQFDLVKCWSKIKVCWKLIGNIGRISSTRDSQVAVLNCLVNLSQVYCYPQLSIDWSCVVFNNVLLLHFINCFLQLVTEMIWNRACVECHWSRL